MTVEDVGLDPVAYQCVGTPKPCRAGTHDRNPPAGGSHPRQIRLPAPIQRVVRDLTLDCTDGDGAEAVLQGAGPLAQPILGADPPADLRQWIGSMSQLGGFQQMSVAR